MASNAEPITAGLVYRQLLQRWSAARDGRWWQRAKEISAGKLAGACQAPTPAWTRRSRIRALGALGLHPEVVATQIVGARSPRGLLHGFGPAGHRRSSASRSHIRHWQRTEVGEAMEAFSQRQKGSSAMPHKKNPILSENLCGLARLLRAYAGAALEGSWALLARAVTSLHSSVERGEFGPDATGIADFMVRRAAHLDSTAWCQPTTSCTTIWKLTGGPFLQRLA